ncbi:MAG: DUF4293 family protein [Bacteroidaceae bacterium]|nr:DUF4293 family protein [Bacteroidaceae bacterium]
MKKLSQRIFLILATALMVTSSLSTLAIFKAPVTQGGALADYQLSSTSLVQAGVDTPISNAPWALMVLAVVIAMVSLFTLLLTFYQNYELQKRSTLFNTIVTVGYLITYGGYFLYYQHALDAISSSLTWWGVAAPVVTLILLGMTLNSIRRTEAAVLREANSFRFRD